MYKHRAFLIIILIAFFSTSFADDEQELRHIKTVLWPQAYRTQDVELLDRLLHESFEVINDAGERSSKKDELEYISTNTWNPGNFKYRIDRLEIFNDSFAIVSGRGLADTYTYTSSNALISTHQHSGQANNSSVDSEVFNGTFLSFPTGHYTGLTGRYFQFS